MVARLAGIVALALAASAGGARAESGRYAVSFAGLGAGTLSFEATQSGDRYSVSSAARPGGVLGMLFDAKVDSQAAGTAQGNRYRPAEAREVTRRSGETTTRTLTYRGGVPAITDDPPDKPSKHSAPPAEQKGTVDTTTAAFAILRDRPADMACQLDLAIYDGRKRHRIALTQAEPRAGGGLTCKGVYSRIAGFSPRDMSGQRDWPLTMIYDRLPDGSFRVASLSFETSVGLARIERID